MRASLRRIPHGVCNVYTVTRHSVQGRRFLQPSGSVSLDYLVGLVGAVPVAADEKDAASAWIFLRKRLRRRLRTCPAPRAEGRL